MSLGAGKVRVSRGNWWVSVVVISRVGWRCISCGDDGSVKVMGLGGRGLIGASPSMIHFRWVDRVKGD